ncbi:MAG: ATP-binding protein [Balneolaceae bacterium]
MLSFLLTGLCIRKAYLLQKKGVVYVALGALGALVFTLIYTFYELGFFEFSFLLYLNTVLIYTFFPFGLTLYIANRYGYLFGTMENEVKARTMELEEAYSELQKSMEDLKATQSQLIQQEKLASLGQLTAGIAHEIKNPLNFVNNFSELSIELIEEAREEIQNSEVLEILDNIEANLRKIHEHGSRADGIVKSMLLHSRGKSGESIPTDVNKLLDEYVNLAYHGMRAVDKSFNIDIQTDFDSTIGMMDVVAQDLSRAFLNIINNAMYAASEYSRRHNKRKPVVSVQTTKNGSKVEVRIRDNGGGIPEKIRAKIFEPFFTTKPTGEGTGLGLSMTFDIIKMHKGTLEVESTPGEFTEFIITLPLITKNGDSK